MAVAWFIVPYVRDLTVPSPARYCAMDDFTAMIRMDGGAWSESEVLGNRAIVKVRASTTTLDLIALTHRRLPVTDLSVSLSTLTNAQRTAIKNDLLAAGYTSTEIDARWPNFRLARFGEVLRFLAQRRLKPRYDRATDTIILDGPVQPCTPIDAINQAVT